MLLGFTSLGRELIFLAAYRSVTSTVRGNLKAAKTKPAYIPAAESRAHLTARHAPTPVTARLTMKALDVTCLVFSSHSFL
jgi:hypothetical protein